MRIAAIDIGTNSIRSRIVEVPVGGSRRTLDDEKAYARLGRGLTATGRLSDEAVADALDALRRMMSIVREHQVTHVRAVATAAVRQAGNADEFLARVRDEIGLEVEVISPEEEARLAFLSAAESVGPCGRCVVIDIGGGSLEIVRAVEGQIATIASLPLGAVVMSERYHSVDPMPREDQRRLVRHVRRELAAALRDEPEPAGRLIGSGGTVAAVAALIAAARKQNLESVHTFEIRRAELSHMRTALLRSSAEERAAMKGMPENRIDIIVAGAVVIDELMRYFGANEIVVNARGMREGLVIDMVRRERGVEAPFDRMQAVRDFGRKCRTDAAHAEQVNDLALALFDQLAPALGLDAGHRPLLEAAALLHDAGYHISYERHHKHSHHLISYAELPGFTSREVRIVAAVARYHRGALPKARHEAMRDLDPADRELVARLAAILRLADGLDRSRGQRVSGVELDLDHDQLTIRISGAGPLDVEAHGARQKADLFEAVFARSVDVHVDGDAPPAEVRSE